MREHATNATRRAGAAASPERRKSPVDDGAADVVAELAELGLSHAAAWYSSAVLYGVGGALSAGVYLIFPDLFPRGLFYLGGFAIVVALFQVFGARRLATSEWATHLRLGIGIGIYAVAVLVAGDKVVAFALLPMVSVPNSCYLYGWRFAMPYVAAAMSIVLVALLRIEGQARIAHAVISAFALAAVAGSMILAKQRTRSLAKRNRRLAYIDPLTEIANTRALHERISAELIRPRGQSVPFALFAMDLDNFKQVNDRFDHSRGDMVLREVAAAISCELEPRDMAARRGGDEFSVLVPNPSGRDLNALADRLKRAIRRARLATCPEVTPGGSVAYVRALPGDELGAVMERADAALHDAKIESRIQRGSAVPASGASSDSVVRSINEAPAYGRSPAIDGGNETGVGAVRRNLTRRVGEALALFKRRSDPGWISTAAILGPIAIVLAAVSVGGMVEPLTPQAGAAIASAFVALMAVCVWAGLRKLAHGWLHMVMTAAYGLVSLAVALAGPSGTALLDLLPVLVLIGFLLFKARTALFYMLLGQTFYGLFAIGGGFTDGVARTAVTVVIVGVIGGLVSKLRVVTVRFTRTNRELSERDALTGVANIRALMQRIESVAERASSQKLHPVLVAIDLDEFKQVNDKYSHSIGDRVLIGVARAVSESVRTDDLVARRGGDEFVVVINDADADLADEAVRRIGDAIARVRGRLCPDLRPTASVASVQWQPGESPADILCEADAALHFKKSQSVELRHLNATA